MDVDLLRLLIPLAALLLLSAYFSGSEAAFFSLSRLEQDSLKRRSGSRLAAILSRIFSSPDDILITLLTGNMFVNVFASSLGEAIGERIFRFDTELFSIISMNTAIFCSSSIARSNFPRFHSSYARVSIYSARSEYACLPVITKLTRK